MNKKKKNNLTAYIIGLLLISDMSAISYIIYKVNFFQNGYLMASLIVDLIVSIIIAVLIFSKT